MTVTLDPRVLELAASRICHDLVSPVGAVSNGIELMEDGGAGGEAMTLVADSARLATVRLKVFRLCYGAAGTDRNVGFKDIREAFSELIRAGRVQVAFDPGLDGALGNPPRGYLKVLLNLLILADECGHGDGLLSVAPAESGVRITVTGKNPAFREGAEAALKREVSVEDLDPRLVHAYLTGAFAAHFGLPLEWAAGAGLEFVLGFGEAV